MVYDNSWFCEEEREGFVVSSTMKRVWAAEMEVLEEIDKLCKRHGIRYFIDGGTLLGAVRHQGYIPWDDDIDIAMLRGDYNRFLKVAHELPKPLYLCHNTFSAFEGTIAFVQNSRDFTYNKERLERFHGCPYVLGVDIFPWDYVPRDAQDAALQKEIYLLIGNLMRLLRRAEVSHEEKERALKQVEEICGVSIDRTQDIRHQLYRLLDFVSQMYNEEESDNLAMFYLFLQDKSYVVKKDWYKESVMLNFEHMSLPAPREYDKVLRSYYGDYNKRVKFTAGHDWPFYKKQDAAVKKFMEEQGLA